MHVYHNKIKYPYIYLCLSACVRAKPTKSHKDNERAQKRTICHTIYPLDCAACAHMGTRTSHTNLFLLHSREAHNRARAFMCVPSRHRYANHVVVVVAVVVVIVVTMALHGTGLHSDCGGSDFATRRICKFALDVRARVRLFACRCRQRHTQLLSSFGGDANRASVLFCERKRCCA